MEASCPGRGCLTAWGWGGSKACPASSSPICGQMAKVPLHTIKHQLDGLHQLRTRWTGQALHVVVAQGHGQEPSHCLSTHGSPGSFLEYLKVLPLLSDPGAHGADPADAFTVDRPIATRSRLSGPPPPTGFAGRQVAALWRALIASGLGYKHHVAHRSDLGAGVTAWLAADQTHCTRQGDPPRHARPYACTAPHTEPETAYAAAVEPGPREGRLRPRTRHQARHAWRRLSEPPAGLAAWIAEKVVAWSSTRSDGSPAFDRELLLSTLTLLDYWHDHHVAVALLVLSPRSRGRPCQPIAPLRSRPRSATSGGERVAFPSPPRELADRYSCLSYWAEHPVGGHFPAVAEPELLAQTLRDVFRSAR